MNDRVRIEVQDGIAEVILNRADKINGLDHAMFEALVAAAKQVRANRNIRAVILRGDGRGFCAGLDFKSWGANRGLMLRSFMKWGVKKTNLYQEACWCWRRLPVPVIAVIHGACYGGGLQLALAADMRVAAPDADLCIMEAKWGLIPDMTGSVTLRELLPKDVAMKLTMSGERISGARAHELGLVTEVTDDPLTYARALAAQIAERSPDAVALTKRLFARTWQASERWAFRVESALQLKLLLGRNHKEALRANAQKRAPQYAARSVK
ncbi:crotonase/enoyl-CoA hydratase family protein [Sinimarinibacterium sp. NLF-5-8]|uniref:crotonase/enoyl-CoA hydratase family protein n=1 Tax=Sinimarinibacterium sp. NLF-5-8 TaxID=2698684 RepID=UPI00137BBE10|nr:crotonase/enoyl-CoA hydratase family protein [Sinimarinibacterium sp. NLF-5-8]QHS11179.1 crotonase/enoyl-CoA hydratase family protein [Sinimarinibacterium sp. NLF-5-8]